MFNPLINIAAMSIIILNSPIGFGENENLIASHEISLENRHPIDSVNEVMKHNILLNLDYLSGLTLPKDNPYTFDFRLNPNETFAFHDNVLHQYRDKVYKTTNAHFNLTEGFKSDGYLVGDGVCHLASLINWVARDANLEVYSPKDHDFANIPEIPKEHGVSIYYYPGSVEANASRNLYITNNYKNSVIFKFSYERNSLKVSVFELN